MDPRAESIKQEVDETLEDITHKMEQIEAKVVDSARETYENVKQATQEKVEKVKQKLDVRHMTQERPWTMFGISIGVGFVVTSMVHSRTRRSAEYRRSYREEPEEDDRGYHAEESGQVRGEEEEWGRVWGERELRPERPRRLGSRLERKGGIRTFLEEHFGDDFAALRTAAITSAGQTLRETLREAFPRFAEEYERARAEREQGGQAEESRETEGVRESGGGEAEARLAGDVREEQFPHRVEPSAPAQEASRQRPPHKEGSYLIQTPPFSGPAHRS